MNIKKILNIILALVLASLVTLLTCLFLHYYKDYMFQTLSASNEKQLQLISQKTDAMITGANTVADLLYQDEDIIGTLLSHELHTPNMSSVQSKIDLLYTKYYSAFSQFGLSFDIVCIGENGFQYSTCGYTNADYELLKSYSWYKKHRTTGKELYSVTNFVPIPKSGGKTYCYALVKNLYQVNGDFAGTIIVFVDQVIFASAYSGYIREDSILYLLNEYSTIVSSSDPTKIGTSPTEILDYLFVRGNHTYDTYTNPDGIQCLCVKYTSPVTNWTIFEQIPLDNIMKPVHKINQKLILAAAFLYLVALYIITRVTKPISQTIRHICLEMENSISRNFTHLQINSQLKEIQSICHSYNHLCDEIGQLITDVHIAEKQANDAKFDFLKAQINPHFLYNTLFSIKCTVSMNQPAHACEMISLLISLLRNSVNSNDDYISLLEETIMLKKYIQLQNLRYNNKVQFSFVLPQELMPTRILRFLIQPLIENVFLHAVPLGSEQVDLLIRFHQKDQDLLIEICDTGVGFDPKDFPTHLEEGNHTTSSHIGLYNIQNRIHLLYGKKYGLSISSNTHYRTIITLRLPKQEGEAEHVSYPSR